MKTLIIDDEAPGREALAHYVGRYCENLEVVGSADGIKSALLLIKEHRPDLLFLDIEMPYGNGFDLLEQLPEDYQPQVVFVTAFEQYALQALRASAAHYLLKPIVIDELIEAVERVKTRMGMGEQAATQQLLQQRNKLAGPKGPERLALPLIDGLELVQVSSITHLRAADNFTEFHVTDGRRLLICRKLSFYADLLKAAGFYRLHRSTVVNLAEIQRYVRGGGGAVILRDGTELSVAKNRRAGLLELFAGG